MQTELTEGQLNTFNSLLKYKDGSAERYRDFCFNKLPAPSKRQPRVTPESKTCGYCGSIFRKNPKETNSNFINRNGCCKSCSLAIARKKKGLNPSQARVTHRTCQLCDRQFTIGEKELYPNFLKRKACSAECRNRLIGGHTQSIHESQSDDPRTCKSCGIALVRRPYEKTSNYRNRSTCSKTCQYKLVAHTRQKNNCTQPNHANRINRRST